MNLISMENYYPQLYFGSIHILLSIVMFCAFLLWSQRSDGQRSRRFLALTWFVLLLMCVGWLPMVYRGEVIFKGMFPINILVFGLLLVALMTLYPIEVVIPRWLDKRRLLLLSAPVILVFAVCGAMHLFGNGFRVLGTTDDIVRYWHEPNVWIRFPIVMLIYGYAFILYYIPQNKMRGNITLNWIRTYTFGNIGIALFYMGMILFGAYPAGIFHALYFAIYVGCITYQELYVRLFIPDSERLVCIATNSRVNAPKSQLEKELWVKLENYMQKGPAWRNPNLSISLLSNALEANQSQIATLLKSMGYTDFDDYVAELRIREFCNIVDKGDSITIEDTFFQVGFRYRNVASEQFIRIMHQPPEEYIRKREAMTFNP